MQKLFSERFSFFSEGWQWANEQMFKFCWRSGSPSGYGFAAIGRHEKWYQSTALRDAAVQGVH